MAAKTKLSFAAAAQRIMPPWLQRDVGARVMTALGEQIDTLVDRTASGVLLRFPGVDLSTVDTDERALGYIGRERRIRRGIVETGLTYARRLRLWWETHQTRGSPYALLRQLRAFFTGFLDVRIDVVAEFGTRHWMDPTGVITRDAVTWEGDGSGGWAHLWVFFYVDETIPLGSALLITQAGDFIVTMPAGDFLVATTSIAVTDLSPTDEELFTLIPREWSAAHIPYVTVVLLWGTRRLWNYPQPVPTWAAWGASGALWGEAPVVLRAE